MTAAANIITQIRAHAQSGNLTAFEAMQITNALRFAVADMPVSHPQAAALDALVGASFSLCVISESEGK